MRMNHYNVTPESTIITVGGEYILGEVNLSRSLDNSINKLHEFSLYYTSPMILNRKGDNKADIWSLGCILYEMCNLKPPFTIEDINNISQNPSISVKLDNLPNCFSKELNDIVMKMLVVDPNKRIGFSELMECNYIKEELDKDCDINILLNDFLINTPTYDYIKKNDDISNIPQTTILIRNDNTKTVEKFFLGYVTTNNNVSIYDVVCNNAYFEWLLHLRIKRVYIYIYINNI